MSMIHTQKIVAGSFLAGRTRPRFSRPLIIRPLVLLLLAGLSTTSCLKTFPIKPDASTPVIVVGQLRLEAKNYTANGDASINGRHAAGIEIIVKDLTTNQSELLRTTGEEGFFFFKGVSGHRYQVLNLFYEVTGTGFNRSYIRNDLDRRVIVIPDATATGPDGAPLPSRRVLSLGELVWKSDNLTGTTVEQSHATERVKADFERRFPKSEWNRIPWQEIGF
jgi:hypothetical protein